MKNVSSILLLVLAISGCANAPGNYSSPSTALNDQVKITTFSNSNIFFSSEFSSHIRGIYKSDGTVIYETSFWGPNPDDFIIDPGEYKFKIGCVHGPLQAFPSFTATVSAGKKYQAYCEIEKVKGILGLPTSVAIGKLLIMTPDSERGGN
ncbi:hypothetical protein [Litorivivens sp.]|uniref:hypothetical protein n=1 Tax=Litorivivens sp. TaxID=2020868 RepID=UPI00356A2618